jgi:protein-tyrosine phosphatase
MRILFVCSNNLLRSPFAAALCLKLAPEYARLDISCSSAGSYAGQGARACDPVALPYLTKHGVDLSAHRTRSLSQQLALECELIAVLDEESRQFIELSYARSIYEKIRFMPLLIAEGVKTIADPTMQEESYAESLRLCAVAVRALLTKLARH